jgi:cell division protein FtsI (penicillin-binding protein 3)
MSARTRWEAAATATRQGQGRGTRIRGQLLLALAGACLLALVGRLCYIDGAMSAEGTRLATYLADQQRTTVPIMARRGDVLDAANRVLAGSQERPSIFADPTLIQDPELIATRLAPILETHPERVRTRAKQIREMLSEAVSAEPKKHFVWLERRVEVEQEKEVRRFIHDCKIVGVGVVDEPFRRYPMHTVAAHVVGFVDIDGNGLEGIERRYDAVLKGKPGSLTVYRDAARRPMWSAQANEGFVPPRNGMTLKLTVDAAIQEVLESQVAGAVEHFKAHSGVGVVMNPKSGEVLAMASVPTYDPNDPSASPPDARRNRVLTDPTEPGSTFKPFVASAALTEKVTHAGDTVFCHNGMYAVGARRLHDHHPYGDLTFEQIVIKSSNIGMAILGQRLGNERLHRYLSAPLGFRFGTPTGIDLDGEDGGILLPLRKWTSFSTTSVPMGQEVAVTPLQLATAFCAIVNGGKFIRPRIVRAVIDPRGEVVQEFTQPQIISQVIPPDIAEFMTKTVLVGVVNEGTGGRAKLDRYQVLGKTGTAQIARKDGRGFLPDAYTGSFLGAVPASDPTLVVLVMIRQPQRSIGYYGGTVAAPAVREVMRRSLAYLGVSPDKAPETPDVRQARGARARKLTTPEW